MVLNKFNMKQLSKYILRIADNSFILSHRLGEYSSNGPFLEEDLAITNTALDHIGLSEILYEYVSKIENDGRTADDIAFKRDENQYFNSCLVEQENVDFAFVIVRQYFIDVFNNHFFQNLSQSKDVLLSEMAVKSLKEMKYHLKRSREWVLRLALGTKESHDKLQNAVNELWKFHKDLFIMDEIDLELLSQGISIDLNNIYELWKRDITNHFSITNIEIPQYNWTVPNGKTGVHSEKLGHILSELQFLNLKYPEASW